jgi:hypothetical protein
MRSGAVLLAFGAGGGPDPLQSALVSETALITGTQFSFSKIQNYEGAEHQVPETASFGKR